MTTMKDVAKLAGVSVSTVSNIVNGNKSVNSIIVEKVENAMNELGYKPNANARFLRNKKSNLFGVIFPDINDNIHSDLLKGIESVCKIFDYRLEVYTSGDIAQLEIDAINKLVAQNAEVIFISSCLTKCVQELEEISFEVTKLIFIRRKPTDFLNGTFIDFDEYDAIYKTIKDYSKSNIKTLSALTLNKKFTNEIICHRAIKDACNDFNIEIKKIACVDIGKETSFKEVSSWLDDLPDLILTTNPLLQDGTSTCINYFDTAKRPSIISIDSYSWSTNINYWIKNICLDYYKLGIVAAKKAISLIKNSDSIERENIILPYKPKQVNLNISNKNVVNNTLNILLPQGSAGNALKILSRKFTKMYGTKLNIEILNDEKILDNNTFKNYDIFPLTANQLEEFAESESIIPLDNQNLFNKISSTYSKRITKLFSIFNNTFYALPYAIDCQLLFYKKELFNNNLLSRLYFEKYKTELCVPRNYYEYIQTAKFFTKNLSDTSPVSFGCAIDFKKLVHLFIAILWEIIGNPISNYSFLNKLEVEKALIYLQDIYIYSNSSESKFNTIAEQMYSGEVAMGIAFQGDYTNSLHSGIKQHIDSIIDIKKMTGTYNITDGYSLAINSKTKLINEAIDFFNWFISEDTIIPNNILGGSLPAKMVLSLTELSLINAPLNKCYENIEKGNFMILSKNSKKSHLVEKELHVFLEKFLLQSADLNLTTNQITNLLLQGI